MKKAYMQLKNGEKLHFEISDEMAEKVIRLQKIIKTERAKTKNATTKKNK